MKIFYGVQATGNGHISRARAMDVALKKKGIKIDYLFSGRQRDQLFSMEQFGEFICRPGLTFSTRAGKVNTLATLTNNKMLTLLNDIRTLDLSTYDLVITDFEPISAWAAKYHKVPSIAIGHQYAFLQKVPTCGDNFFTRLLIKWFAPASISFGLHWHHFEQTILPPIIDLEKYVTNKKIHIEENKILVYLGFEDTEEVIKLLQPITNYQFFIYGQFSQQEDRQHIHCRPLSLDGFKQDLITCNGVIANAGFELTSEAISLGKKILVKPLLGQMEQLSNALALEKLKLGMTMRTLDCNVVKDWLSNSQSRKVHYPNVPDELSEWIYQGDWSSSYRLVEKLWKNTQTSNNEKLALNVNP